MNKLEGKIALITGGNSGIGLATAKQFVNEGAYVFITGRLEPKLADAVKQIGPERAVLNLLLQFAVGRANHAHFHFLVRLGADPTELSVLQQL